MEKANFKLPRESAKRRQEQKARFDKRKKMEQRKEENAPFRVRENRQAQIDARNKRLGRQSFTERSGL